MPKASYYFQGFRSPNYTMVPDELFDELLAVLSGAELKAVLYIMRRTFGFKRDADSISLSQMLNGLRARDGHQLDRGAGLSKPTLLQALRSLEEMNIIQRERRRSVEKGDESTVYRLTMASDAPGQKSIPPVVKKFDQGGGQETLPGPWSKNLTTQYTEGQTDEKHQQSVGVVSELTEYGVSRVTAERLASEHSAEYLREKLDLVAWLKGHEPKAVGKNPAGYLRRAIEEDYQAPPGYQLPAERQAAEEAKARKQAELADIVARQDAEQERLRAAERERKNKALAVLRREHPAEQIPGTTLTTETAWQQALVRLQDSMTATNYHTWLAETVLVSCDGSMGVVAAPSTFAADWLRTRLSPFVRKELQQVLGFPVQLEYLAVSELQNSQEYPDAATSP